MSNPLQEVIDYLLDKRNQEGKPSLGLKYLRDNWHDSSIPDLVAISFQIIQMQFTKTSTETQAGEARLTTVSSGIGNRLCTHGEDEGIFTRWDREVRVGDLFIEAYYNTGFIDLYYPQRRNSYHIVSATNKWTALEDIDMDVIERNLKGTVESRPPSLASAFQQHRHELEPVVKGTTEDGPINTEATWVKAIDKLQQTAWKVDDRILDAMVLNEKLFIQRDPFKDNDAKEKKRRSKLIEWAFTTKKAEYLRGKTFYQFIEADYRGRLYYAEPFLNFQGSDLARGLLKFNRAKPMDKYGLFWLAVHTACSYNENYNIKDIPSWCEADYTSFLKEEGLESISVDKMTLEDRVRWTNENMDWICKAGRDRKLFPNAEKTISFLACCLEWEDYHVALDMDTTFYTCLPIPIDGSNNGWQHLGAISKDTKTGELVGLIPTHIQKDFYVQTAKELYNLVDEGELKDLLDVMPMKHIRKGISKRGSMTRAYSAGATKIGENMWFDCKTEDYHEIYGITEKNCMDLAKILIKAISNVCPGPLRTMGYLQSLAGVAIDGKDYLEWTTPSDFEVKYECYYSKECRTRGTISGYNKYNKMCQVNHVAQVYTDFPDVRGFMCGVSPNYIHSMDAAHMARVIDKWNGDFGAVHDSFSTHAPDVELLLAHTKREFIEMYDKDNYFKIIEDQLVDDTTKITTDRPVLGDLQIEEIEDSDYFFA